MVLSVLVCSPGDTARIAPGGEDRGPREAYPDMIDASRDRRLIMRDAGVAACG
ncbi:hypothetical protein J2T08_003278 [Neorhizobium galegae]|uniref:hypothetical protein n=1 Tax=Neorhizobium galegae TaxID=399 RepID=UPI002788043E|nr:hypothetical protein [Neorhizobium galegae]MDQ0135357.1 hypothetical protein [Neorhizobium galegae]